MVMSMNGMGGYGSYGMYGGYGTQNGAGNVPAELKARYGYSFDYFERPSVAKAGYAVTPKAQPSKIQESKFMRFLKMIF